METTGGRRPPLQKNLSGAARVVRQNKSYAIAKMSGQAVCDCVYPGQLFVV
jgi:hypothetical protein